MGGPLYLTGLVVAGYTGYIDLGWYFIFIAALIMEVGYLITRAPHIHGIISRDGLFALPPILVIQLIIYSIPTSIVYLLASLVS
jgi:hypothetical protein